ncbi:NAD(P)H-hydrate dehydratase [Algoriphagus pacificus]|uniref:Bifunctional NAD(P)H-hydrate repair enzyme n=1 Tax=Algoriphagus pacificus TaxID=2811234 RepID=A0ABS3CKX5_9BACT|nr:NAD(P)H-hydrate dehydratase [Algoriphagus pacificus]MBN7817761.1 NAD(P)H-hydrate dehydratase [Algoriphagus pacificus]
MLKILNGNKVKELDASHLQLVGHSSHELMETAALGFVGWYLHQKQFEKEFIYIFCGAGNNGGDGLAIARILTNHGYNIHVVSCFESIEKLSHDARINWDLLPASVNKIPIEDFILPSEGVLIDAFLGVGLKGTLREGALQVIDKINSFSGPIVSVDLPSGMLSDEILTGACVKAAFTITFAFPKLALLLPEHADFVGEIEVVDIGIQDPTYSKFETDFFYVNRKSIPPLHRHFNRFAYKGSYGKVLIAGGSPGKMGALILSAKSALRTGSGLVTCHLEDTERYIIQTAVPEAMATWGLIANLDFYDALGIGPGWGQDGRKHLLKQILEEFTKPVVIDADGLNILAKNPDLLELVPKNSILTPHIGEFNRLVGSSENHLDRLKSAKSFAIEHGLILILKGANTVISLPDGRQLFNSTGTKYMATGGSGDVLTGMITSFLGQGYTPINAAICGVYHHGLAGEIAGKMKRKGLIASDLIEAIPETYIQLDIS